MSRPPALLLAAVVALPGCPPPQGDLGPYTDATSEATPAGDTSATTRSSTAGDADDTAAPAPTTTTTDTPTDADTTDALEPTSTTTTGEPATTTASEPATTTTTLDTTDTHEPTDTGAADVCGRADPLHPFPPPHALLDGQMVHGVCVLAAAAPARDPATVELELECEIGMVVLDVLDGPHADWPLLVGEALDVDLERAGEEQWAVLRRGGDLVYASVRASDLVPPGENPDVYAPLSLSAFAGECPLTPTSGVWPPIAAESLACEYAAPIYLGVQVDGSPPLPLAGGMSLSAPVAGGHYVVDVRAMIRGHNCVPDHPPDTDVDTYAFAVAFQAD